MPKPMPQTPLLSQPLPHHGAEAPAPAPFATAAQAWLWATEVLRRRRLPVASPAWADGVAITAAQRKAMQGAQAELEAEAAQSLPRSLNLPAEATQVASQWGRRFNPHLPQTGAGRYALAQRIQGAVMALPATPQRLLMGWAWGDWADEGRLRAALAIQEKARREGLRVRLSYRYSAQQLGQMMGCSKATAWRDLRAANAQLAAHLQAMGVVEAPVKAPSASPAKPARPVVVRLFK